MKIPAALTLAVVAVQAAPHYTFPDLVGSADWSNIRETANFQTNDPVTNVSSEAIRCYQLNSGGAADTQAIAAGSTITFNANPSIYHPGALSAYMAKVPAGSTAATWDGSGAVWFKVYQDLPTVSSGQYVWPSMGLTTVPFTIPTCIADGDYLFRVEHVALHVASTVNGAQFYLSCAQITVSGGSGSETPTDLVAFPGAYSPTDPGLLINIYDNGGKPYTPAGPAVFTC
ncbi:lytic polysaccharide monooxygenase [Xylariaceae sp. FL0255]|nr:lytic polysaccharide monooxygenase [Xylariaceae sp. FL0255]